MTDGLRFRRYDPRDADAVWALHEWALRDAGTDPADVPGTDDLGNVEAAYVDRGGEFLVGVVPDGTREGSTADGERPLPTTHDGAVVAIGGFRPVEGDPFVDVPPGVDAAELHRMRVAPPRQRRGHGRALLAALERRAAETGVEFLLATTAARQRAAVRFYPAAGYDERGRSTLDEYELVHFAKEL